MAGGRELKLAISIAGRLDKSLGQAANQAQAQLNAISKSANRYAMRASAAIAIATTKYVKESIETYTEYEDAVNSAAAVFNVAKGTEQYEKIAAAARKVPQETIVSAKEGADALKYMALAGWSVENSINAVIPIVKLAAATEMEISRASDLVTDSMMAMGMSYDQVGHYVDVLAKGNNSANYNAMQLLESLTSVGGVFRQLNIGVEDGAALLGVLASQGTKGAEAGTGMNTVLTRMMKQSGEAAKGMEKLGLSLFDAEGHTRNILDVFQEMHDKTANMTEAEMNTTLAMIGGQRGIRVLAKLMEGYNQVTEDGIPLVKYLAEAYRDADGAMDNFYDIKTDTMQGAMERLSRLYESMQIDTIQAIAPEINDLIDHIADRMPDIENAIISVFTRAMPYVKKFMDFGIDHFDDLIKGAYEFMKIFWGFKIGTGAVRGINGTITLFSNLRKLAKFAGIGNVLKGVIGTFTGIGSSAGTAAGGVAALSGSLGAVLIPLAAVAAAVGVAVIAYKAWDKATYHWADDFEKSSLAAQEHANKLTELTSLGKELNDLRFVINSPDSTTQDVENARQRIEEIANLLETEYNLKINTDAPNLNETAETINNIVEGLTRAERSNTLTGVQHSMRDMDSIIEPYKKAVKDLPALERQNKWEERLRNDSKAMWDNMQTIAQETGAREGFSDMPQREVDISDPDGFIKAMQSAARYAKLYDLGDMANYDGTIETLKDAQIFYSAMKEFQDGLAESSVAKDYKAALENSKKFEDSANRNATSLQSILASDVQNGGSPADIQYDTEQFEALAAKMQEAGMSTDDLAMKFVTAQQGFTSLNDALGEGGVNAQQLAQNYIDFKASIGESAESAIMGAALIANGFENAAAAASAGDAAVNNVLADLMRFGEAQGVFDGLDTSAVAEKLTTIAHAANLIPENKVIQISAEGNLEVVEQAENKLANMDDSAAVTINAQDNATGKAEEVQGKLQGLNQIPVNPPINAQDNASSVIDNVSSKLSALDGTTATTTVITEYKTKGKPPGESARGAQSFSGGLTYLNDQKGINDAREVIEYAGRRFWYEGKNVLANIPRGARIYTAAQSKSFINGSHENGLARVPFDGYIAELHEGERVLTANEAAGYNGFNFNDMLSVLADMIAEMRSGGGSDRGGNGGGRIVYAPNITIQGNADEATLTRVMRMSQQEFEEMYDEMQHNRDRTRF